MRPAILSLAAAFALVATTTPATAQVGTDLADARCLMVLQAISRDPKQAEQAARGVYFYLGRLSARGAINRIEPIIKAEAAKLAPAQAQAELARCGAELTARSRELQTVNQRLAASVQSAPAAAKK